MQKTRSPLDSRLARYALIAGAAAAASKPAEASVIYTVEPTPIDFSTGSHSIDVNGDGIEDFYFTGGPLEVMGNSFSYVFSQWAYSSESGEFSSSYSYSTSFAITAGSTEGTSSAIFSTSFAITIGMPPATSTSAIFTTFTESFTVTSATSSFAIYTSGTGISDYTTTFNTSYPVYSTADAVDEVAVLGTDAEAFGTGAVIGSGITSWSNSAPMPDFTSPGNAFLGLEFYDTSGNLYYGFAEFDPESLVGFAFDNVPDTSITTFDLKETSEIPEPGTLPLLALGAAAMELIRRKRTR